MINMEERRLPKAMRAFSTAVTLARNDTPEYFRTVAKNTSIINENWGKEPSMCRSRSIPLLKWKISVNSFTKIMATFQIQNKKEKNSMTMSHWEIKTCHILQRKLLFAHPFSLKLLTFIQIIVDSLKNKINLLNITLNVLHDLMVLC